MADLSEVLGPAFEAGPPPSTGPALVRYAGGKRALVQALTGLDRAPRRGDYASPAEFEAQRRRWRSASRRVQRWDPPRGQQRRGLVRLAPLPPPVRRRLQRDATVRKRDEAVSHGIRVRMLATVLAGTPPKLDERTRWMPAPPGPGVLLGPQVARGVLAERDGAYAAAEFQRAFLEAYGFPDGEIIGVTELKVWPEGEAEPR